MSMTSRKSLRRFAVALLASVFCLYTNSSNPQPPPPKLDPGALLPPETILLLCAPDISASKQRLKETALYSIWMEPDVQAFVGPIKDKIATFLDSFSQQIEQEAGLGLADVKEVLSGRIAVALTNLHTGEAGLPRVDVPSSALKFANEAKVKAALKKIATEQSIFKRLKKVDQDRDGVGEYGLLCELCGQVPFRPSTQSYAKPPFVSEEFTTEGAGGDGTAEYSGYKLRMFLPTGDLSFGDDGILGGTPELGGPPADTVGIDLQENYFVIYAWPMTPESGDHAFVITDKHILFQTDMKARQYCGPSGPPVRAAFADGTDVLRQQLGGVGNDGNAWALEGAVPPQKMPELRFELVLLLAPTVPDSIHDLTTKVLEKVAEDPDALLEKRNFQGVEIAKLSDREGKLCACYGWVGDLFVASLGQDARPLEEVILRQSGRIADSLSNNPNFRASMPKVKAENADFALYFSITNLLARFEEKMDHRAKGILTALGVTSIDSVALSSTMEEEAIRDVIYVHSPGPRAGLTHLFSAEKVSPELVDMVPQEAVSFTATRFNPTLAWSTLESIITSIGPEPEANFRTGVQALENYLGLSISQHLMPALGNELVSYSVPSPAGRGTFGLSDMVFLIKLNDPGLAAHCADTIRQKMMQWAVEHPTPGQPDNPPYVWHQMQHAGRMVYYVVFHGSPLPINPTYSLTDEYLIFGFLPETVALALDRLAAPGPSVKESADFQRVSTKLSNDYGLLYYNDLRRSFPATYDGIKLLVGLMATNMQHDFPIDPSTMPPAEVITCHLFGYVVALRSDREGITIESYSPVGNVYLTVASAAVLAAIAVPNITQAREKAQTAVCKSNLKQLALAAMMYVNDHNVYPSRFADLYPRYIGHEEVLLCRSDKAPNQDADGIPSSYALVPGIPANVPHPSKTILIYETAPRHNMHRNVAFADGHVETIPEATFRELLKQ